MFPVVELVPAMGRSLQLIELLNSRTRLLKGTIMSFDVAAQAVEQMVHRTVCESLADEPIEEPPG